MFCVLRGIAILHPSCTGVLLSSTSTGSWFFWCLLAHICFKFTCWSVHIFSSPGLLADASSVNTGNSCSPLASASYIHIALSQGWNLTHYPTQLHIHLWLAFVSLTPDLNHLNHLLHGLSKCCIQICHALEQQHSQSVSGISIYFCWNYRGQDCGPSPFHPTPARTVVKQFRSILISNVPLSHSPWWTIMDINMLCWVCGCRTSHQMSPPTLSNVGTPFPLSDSSTHSVRGPNVHGFIRNPFLLRVMCPTWKTLSHTLQLGSSWKKTKIITCTAVFQMPYALSQSAACYRTFASPAGAMPSKLVNRALCANVVQSSAVPAPKRDMQAVIHLFPPHKESM